MPTIKETQMDDKKTVHISFDDVIEVFRDLTIYENEYKNLWDNPFLSFLKRLHDSFGAVFSLYVFCENEDFSLDAATGKYCEQFRQNSKWLRFGFHAYSGRSDYCTEDESLLCNDYCNTVKELKRIVGTESIDSIIRLHRFVAERKSIERMKGLICGLLTADDQRISYGLSKEICKNIDAVGTFVDENDIWYVKTDIRLERLEDSGVSLLNNLIGLPERKHIEIFTHEWCMNNFEIQEKLYWLCCEIWKNENCVFRYYKN